MHIAFLFYHGMTALDAIGPYEVLWRLPSATVDYVAKRVGPIQCPSGLRLYANRNFSEVPQADVLLIPGGRDLSDIDDETLKWIRQIHDTTTWTTAVCTGSLILGAAGILTGLNATSHWARVDQLQSFGAKPKRQRIVVDGKVITAAGVSAGIDMALSLAAKITNAETAERLQLTIEYDPEPPFDMGSPAKAPPLMCAEIKNGLSDLAIDPSSARFGR